MKEAMIENQLRQAEELCKKRNARLTPQRLEVLRLIAQQKSAISAYNLLDLLRQTEPQAKPPTIYRALDFLLEQGFIHRIESTNSFVLCHHFSTPSHNSVFFICNRCGRVQEYTTESIKHILHRMAIASGFSITHNIVEPHGLCLTCIKVQAY
ncbi:zinc uptake transcriptional repressor Zur [Candidatus Curculioniphilus buchneri]|uniref:zinc uptake transcriptional repressor Zur n=1 Tax=Candidatus Curculioniphilus buchneri TaxID=690594 RepID=UPI00376EDA9D